MLKSNNKKSNMQKSIGKKATFKKSNSTIWTVFTKTRCLKLSGCISKDQTSTTMWDDILKKFMEKKMRL